MADAARDENYVPTLLGTLSTDGKTTVRVKANPTNHGLEISDAATGSDNGPANAPRDSNFVPALMAVSSVDGITPVVVYADSSGESASRFILNMAQAARDQNYVPTLLGVSNSDGKTPVAVYADPVTHRLLVDSAGGGTGTVTEVDTGTGLTGGPITTTGTISLDSKLAPLDTLGSAGQVPRVNAGATALEYYTPAAGTVTAVSVASANGFAGSSSGGATPALTLSTTVNSPVLAGNGTAISAATTTGSGSTVVLGTSPSISGATITTSSVNGVTLTTGGGTSTFLNANGAYSTPSGSGTVNAGTANQAAYYATSTNAVSGSSDLSILTGNITVNAGGAHSGQLTLSGASSGSTTVTSASTASGTLTLPSATDTLVGKATTDTFTNKTYDTAGTGNSFSINGVAVTANTGTGAVARAAGPTFTTPTLGVATATSINKMAITAPATSSTLAVADGKTFTANNTITLAAGADSQTFTFPATSATVAGLGTTQTFTGQDKFNNFIDVNNAVTVSSNAGTVPVTFRLNTFTNSSAATMAITMATASAVDGQMTIVRIYDFSGVAETIGWTNTENSTVSVPTTSNGSTTLPLTVGFMFNTQTTKWRCIASA